MMQKINAIFVKYAYPPLPLAIVPFTWVFVFVVFSLPDWFSYNWFWPIIVWFVIFVIAAKCFVNKKRKRIRQEVKNFNKIFSSTGNDLREHLM